MKVPLVIRLIIGRGWGQGPQHSQSLETLFASVPGLKVVCPSNPYDAKGMLISSIEDNNPVIFYEHRWLHSTYGNVPKKYYKTNIHSAENILQGKDITLIGNSYMTVENIRAAKILKNYNIFPEVIDIRSLRPLNTNKIIKSINKTKHALIVDNGLMKYGISAEIMADISEKIRKKNNIAVRRIGLRDAPIPSSRELAKYSYPTSLSICKSVGEILNTKLKNLSKYKSNLPSDVPDSNFNGPF